MRRIICAALAGAALLAGFLATGDYGLSPSNVNVYLTAAGLEKSDGNFGFKDFRFTDYPIAFYDGDNDYTVTSQNGELGITKRSPVFNSIVATAYETDGGYEVISPTIEKMSAFMTLGRAGAEYTSERHAAVLWHEAFHCYQMTNYSGFIEKICPEADERIIVEQADSNTRAAELLKMQMRLLESSVRTNDIDKIRANMVQYKTADEERAALLPESVRAAENYYTTVEGTACYVEASAYRELCPEGFEEEYLSAVSLYVNGSAKYYRIGMAECMILEKLGTMDGYTFSEPPVNLIYKELGI